MAAANDLTKMVPGFEFLQSLMKGAGAAFPGVAGMPGMNQWVAPTLDPAELDKRIQELKTVQFWLEQNARLLGTTVQALEVQRMTLSTLQTMNLPLADLGNALKIKPTPHEPSAKPAPKPGPKTATAGAAAAVDPLQWWGALTQQFSTLAAQAMKDVAVEPAAKTLAAKAKPAAPRTAAPRKPAR